MTTDAKHDARQDEARRGFLRLMIILVSVGVLTVIAALAYLGSSGLISTPIMIVIGVGVFLCMVIGGGLMALGFFSANSGYDESVTWNIRSSGKSED